MPTLATIAPAAPVKQLFCREGYHFIERGTVRRESGRRIGSLCVDADGKNVGEYEAGVDRGEFFFDADPTARVKCDEHRDYAVWRAPLPVHDRRSCDGCGQGLLVAPVRRRSDGMDYAFCTSKCATEYDFNG